MTRLVARGAKEAIRRHTGEADLARRGYDQATLDDLSLSLFGRPFCLFDSAYQP